MLDRLKSFLGSLQERPRAEPSADDPRVAAAALMVHVIDADGVREDAERRRLREVLSEAYDLTGSELDRVVEAGEEAEREAVDFYAFTSVARAQAGARSCSRSAPKFRMSGTAVRSCPR